MTAARGAPSRVAASGLFLFFAVLTIGLSAGPPAPLALLCAVSLAFLFGTTRAAARRAFGPLLGPLTIVADLGLILTAAAVTGGARSAFALLLPARLALAWQVEGRQAARFLTAVSIPAAALVLAWSEPIPREPARLLAPLLFVLAAPALLAALEITSAGAHAEAEERKGEAVAAEPVPATPALPPEAAGRDRSAELLHDLASPLSVIRVYCDLIRESASRGQLPNVEHLENLAREVELAERLAAGGRPLPASAAMAAAPARDPSASTTAATPTADLVEILGSLATAYRLGQGARHRIEFIAERPQLPVAADPVALQRAFRNVVENAVKYTGEGGEIRIRAGAAGADAFVVIKDTGIGMSAEERARAFDYSFRGTGAVNSGRPGKGLGLALTREILEANGGRIAISSESGFGSEVTILLPFQRRAR